MMGDFWLNLELKGLVLFNLNHMKYFSMEMYISDGENNCISIFTTDGHFIPSFGERGNGLGKFNRPHGMAFDGKGNI